MLSQFDSLRSYRLYLPGSSVLGFPRREHWSELPLPPLGDLPGPGIELVSPELAGGFFTTEPLGKPVSV